MSAILPTHYTGEFRLARTCKDGENRKVLLTLVADRYEAYFQDFLLQNYAAQMAAFLYDFPNSIKVAGTIDDLDLFEEEMHTACTLMGHLAQAKRDVQKLTALPPDAFLDTAEEDFSRQENYDAYRKEAARACAAFKTARTNLKTYLSNCHQIRIDHKADGTARMVEHVTKISRSLNRPKNGA